MSKLKNIREFLIIAFVVTLVFQTWGDISLTKWIIILIITLGCTGISFTIASLLGIYDEK